MDSEDEYDDTKLPDFPEHKILGELDPELISKLTNGESVEFEFDSGTGATIEDTVEPNESERPVLEYELQVWKKLRHGFLSQQDRELMETMIGDFSGIEKMMVDVTPDGSVKKLLIRPGTGRELKSGDLASIHYIVSCEFMDDVADSTYKGFAKPHRFRVSQGGCIGAMEIGLATMRVGEIAKFLGTPEMGYGKAGVLCQNANIPPNSRVMVQMEVIEVTPINVNIGLVGMTQAEKHSLPFQEFFPQVEAIKDLGSDAFKRENYDVADKWYKEAYECSVALHPASRKEAQQSAALFVKICCNLSLCAFRTGKPKRAFRFAEKASETVGIPQMLKGKPFYLCAKSQFELGNYEDALKYIKKADVALYDPDIRNFMEVVEAKVKEIAAVEKENCRRMMKGNSASREKDSGTAAVTAKLNSMKIRK